MATAKSNALSPKEAAFIAANAYFTLSGWEKRYQFNMSGAEGKAPKVTRGQASRSVVSRNVVGSGPRSVAQAGICNSSLGGTLSGSTGSNLIGRVKTGFGYMLQFERDGKKHLVIATRGTRPEIGYPDLLTDINISTGRHFPGLGPVHSGFYDTYKSLMTSLRTNEAEGQITSADYIHCVGHSLGGAVANLVAVYCAKKGANVKLYTYGAPRVGLKDASYDKRMNALLGEENIYRVSHNLDPIPMIPIAPYIHVLPMISDKNNFFIGSPISSISMDNHDTNNYINSVGDKEWDEVRSAKLAQVDMDRHYFKSWVSDENWLKRTLGVAGNKGMAVLLRILRGMLAEAGRAITDIVTAFDLIALAIRSGLNYVSSLWAKAVNFIGECAKVVGMKIEVSQNALRKLLDKMITELKITAKLAIKKAEKLARSREFKAILAATAAGSTIGLMTL